MIGKNGWTGYSASSAGDINGDGLLDLIIGAPYADKVYLVYGKEDGLSDIDLKNLTSDQGFIFNGESGSETGMSVSWAGDVNGDGSEDFIIGAPYTDSKTGMSHVVYGAWGNHDVA